MSERTDLNQGDVVMVQWTPGGRLVGPYTVELVDGTPFAAMSYEVGSGQVQWDRCLDPSSYPWVATVERIKP